jgi:hypothetical protein
MDDSQFESWLERNGLSKLVASDGSWVVIAERQVKSWEKVSSQDKAALIQRMRLWCRGDDYVTPEMLKFEKRLSGVALYAFKPPKGGQGRVYGTQVTLVKKRVFVVGAVDVKKQNKADDKMFKRAADFIAALRLG